MTLSTLSIWIDRGATVSAARRALVNRNTDLGFTMPLTTHLLAHVPQRCFATILVGVPFDTSALAPAPLISVSGTATKLSLQFAHDIGLYSEAMATGVTWGALSCSSLVAPFSCALAAVATTANRATATASPPSRPIGVMFVFIVDLSILDM